MKIGTDGVLLGAWANPDRAESILDIGAGTGVIALMLAQRSSAALIDAIELEEEAYVQCVENFENSPWGDRLFCYHADFRDFYTEIEESYDLIISNPPFFEEWKKGNAQNQKREIARSVKSLTHPQLLEGVARLLAPTGRFCTIIPFQSERMFLKEAENHQLYPQELTRVKGTPQSAVKRSLLSFGTNPVTVVEKELTIELERHHYTEEYIALTKDFYLKM